jgi:polyisoprenoid-binding protein YceI
MKRYFLVRGLFLACVVCVCALNLAAQSSSTRSPKPSSKTSSKAGSKPSTQLLSYLIDKEESQAGFKVKTRLKNVDGVFGTWTANLKLDPTTFTTLAFDVTVQSASISTGSGIEDNEIKNKNFFAVEEYPVIKLVSRKIVPQDKNHGQMTADFTLRGITKGVLVPLILELDGKGSGSLKGEFEIDRKDFGITHNMTLVPIADTVNVYFDFKIQEKPHDFPIKRR